MSRFIDINGFNVNTDMIRQAWVTKRDGNTVSHFELDNEIVIETTGNYSSIFSLDGCNHITQVIPCVKPLYTRYRGENGEVWEQPVYYLGLCASGEIRPLEVIEGDGIAFADDVGNYIGLYEEETKGEPNNENR